MKALEWLRLLFVRRQFNWCHEERTLIVFKVMGGKTFILHTEPIEYGDCRNHQISRWEPMFRFRCLRLKPRAR